MRRVNRFKSRDNVGDLNQADRQKYPLDDAKRAARD